MLEGLHDLITQTHREGSMTCPDPVVIVMRCEDGEYFVSHKDRQALVEEVGPAREVARTLKQLDSTSPSLIPYWCVLLDQGTQSVVCVTQMTRMVMTGLGSTLQN